MIRQLRNTALTLVAGLLILSTQAATAQEFVDLPLELEIELALSALPADLQENATIYVRDPADGFVIHKQGTNGWATFVARTSARFYQADWEFEFPADMIIPQAHDAQGQAQNMRPYMDLEKMRIKGVTPSEAKEILRKRFADGTYAAPTRGGVSYMLAPIHRAYMQPAQSNLIDTVSFPHHMPFAPNMPTENLGQMDPHYRSGTLDHGGADTGPHGYLYFMVQSDQADTIRAKYADLLLALCDIHANWCLPTQ
ncbi:hypothetical protein [Maritalea porphyrae]|uniref:hypothetical protein n=1 Tax=Maritalea porphyrae TaxID=880732 RepID=UPI0022AEED84|nr:hypothetical protein [Maritalea porphyrae]MCZ4274132.1 hypothetical protein [Maritalea porphyrae]